MQSNPQQTATSAHRRGYTLFEIILVLAILVAVGAIAVPIFRQSFEIEQLRKGSDALRTAWAKARVEAMTTGLTHVFRSEYGSNKFVVAVRDNGESETEASSAVTVTERPGELPNGIVFYATEKANSARDGETADAGTQTAPDIYFFADGTTSTAQVLLANQNNRFIKVGLRGLTGVTEVGEIVSGDELEQQGTVSR